MLNYYTSHYWRIMEVDFRLTLLQRLRVLVGLPVVMSYARNYSAEHETPLESVSLDVRASVTIGGDGR